MFLCGFIVGDLFGMAVLAFVYAVHKTHDDDRPITTITDAEEEE